MAQCKKCKDQLTRSGYCHTCKKYDMNSPDTINQDTLNERVDHEGIHKNVILPEDLTKHMKELFKGRVLLDTEPTKEQIRSSRGHWVCPYCNHHFFYGDVFEEHLERCKKQAERRKIKKAEKKKKRKAEKN